MCRTSPAQWGRARSFSVKSNYRWWTPGSTFRPTDEKTINGMASSVVSKQQKKFKVQTSAGKATASLFGAREEILLMEFLDTDVTVNSKRHVQTLQKFKQRIRKNRPNTKMNQFFLPHDNASPHTILQPREAIATMGCTGLPHPP